MPLSKKSPEGCNTHTETLQCKTCQFLFLTESFAHVWNSKFVSYFTEFMNLGKRCCINSLGKSVCSAYVYIYVFPGWGFTDFYRSDFQKSPWSYTHHLSRCSRNIATWYNFLFGQRIFFKNLHSQSLEKLSSLSLFLSL